MTSNEILIREDGPREGFQSLKKIIPLEDKLKLIEMLEIAGANSIEVTSFVSPEKMPQMKDAPEIAEQIKPKKGVRYRALYLNKKGFENAIKHKNLNLEGYILLSPSEEFLKRNCNQTIDDAVDNVPNLLNLFDKHSLEPERLMLSCSFGDKFSGKIDASKTLDVLKQVINKIDNSRESSSSKTSSLLDEVTFADTTGYAGPEAVKKLVSETKSIFPDLNIGLHLHDTRGLGLASVYAGYLEGATRFDSSVSGMGGCPFIKNAAGNVATEDMAFMFEELGVSTGLNLEAYIEASKFAEQIAGKKLPGKLKDGGII